MYWLPFAVSKEHWSKARLVAEEILGLIASGNTRSFAPDMVYTVISRFNYPLPLLTSLSACGRCGRTNW